MVLYTNCLSGCSKRRYPFVLRGTCGEVGICISCSRKEKKNYLYLNGRESEPNDAAIVAGLKAAHMDDVRVTHRAVNIRVLLMCERLWSTEEVIEMGASTKIILFIEYVE